MKALLGFLVCLIPLSLTGQGSYQDLTQFRKYATDNQMILKTGKSKGRVVFMGNSITEFWDSTFFVKNGFINRGISGQTSGQMLLRFRADVLDLQPGTVVIMAGINDIAENMGPVTIDQVFGNIRSMTELARANKIRVILCSVLPAYSFPWRPGIEPMKKVIALNKMIRQYATSHKLTYVDYYSQMVDKRPGLDKRYSDDEVHPNNAGYRVMEPLILKGIKGK